MVQGGRLGRGEGRAKHDSLQMVQQHKENTLAKLTLKDRQLQLPPNRKTSVSAWSAGLPQLYTNP